MPGRSIRNRLLSIFEQALRAVGGRGCVASHLRSHPMDGPVELIAVGKAAASMALGARDVLGEQIQGALVITKYGHLEPGLEWAQCLESGHPWPDEMSLAAGRALLAFMGEAPPDARFLVLISGGASALVEALAGGLGLDELERANRWLLASGLDIDAMNRVRKSLSMIKGGRLAAHLHGRGARVLLISDVPGDDPATIGSGLLVPDVPGVMPDLPDWLGEMVTRAPAPPSSDDPMFETVEVHLVATLEHARKAAAAAAQRDGFRVRLHGDLVTGDALQAGRRLAAMTLGEPGVLHVWGGETTVCLPPEPGRGGRNQSLALAAAMEIAGREDVWFLSSATDGTDGPGEDAGALVDGGTVERGEIQGFSADESLRAADAGNFLEASGDLIVTGPTGTNVMDLMLGYQAA